MRALERPGTQAAQHHALRIPPVARQKIDGGLLRGQPRFMQKTCHRGAAEILVAQLGAEHAALRELFQEFPVQMIRFTCFLQRHLFLRKTKDAERFCVSILLQQGQPVKYLFFMRCHAARAWRPHR